MNRDLRHNTLLSRTDSEGWKSDPTPCGEGRLVLRRPQALTAPTRRRRQEYRRDLDRSPNSVPGPRLHTKAALVHIRPYLLPESHVLRLPDAARRTRTTIQIEVQACLKYMAIVSDLLGLHRRNWAAGQWKGW